MRRRAWGCAILAMVVALVGDPWGSDAATPTPQDTVRQARVVAGANVNNLPVYVGLESGAFLRHGLDVKVKTLATGPEMAKAMMAGEAELGSGAVGNLPISLERGLPAVAIAGLLNDATTPYTDQTLSIIAGPQSGIRGVEDLVGKRIGGVTGATGDAYVRYLLERKGHRLPANALVNVPPGSQLAALQLGQVDAIATWEPFGTLLMEKIPGAITVARGDGKFPFAILATATHAVMKEQPEVVYAFLAGLSEAAQRIRRSPAEAAEIATRWVPGLELGIAQRSLRHISYDPRLTQHTARAYEESMQILLEQKKMRAPYPWTKAADPRPMERVEREHAAYFSDLKPAR